jgi:hypothetical protein
MYPSINISEGISVLQHILSKSKYTSKIQSIIVEITEWVLIHNYMTFNDKIYLQTNGTAMGTSLSVAFACLYVGYKENVALHQFKHRGLADPLIYKRLVDDTMAIFQDMESAILYTEILKTTLGEGLNLEYTIDMNECTFMDVKLYKSRTFRHTNNISTTLYQKPMNKYLFLPPTSAHTRSVFKAWIIAYIIRIRIICSEDKEYSLHKYNFYKRLLARGYTSRYLNNIFNIHFNRNEIINRIMTRHNQIKTSRQLIKLTIPLDNRTIHINKLIKKAIKHTHELRQDIHYKELFNNRETIITFHMNKNLSQHLVKSTITKPKTNIELKNSD